MRRESDIVYQDGIYWVLREERGYGVYKLSPSGTHGVLDGGVLYPLNADGLSIALARCKYIARDMEGNKGREGKGKLLLTH